MSLPVLAQRAANELADTLGKINDRQIDALIEQIVNCESIFFSGAGRSLLMLRGFAMRLMHLGFRSYVVGDTSTPAFTKKDLLIVGSGSGETETIVSIVQKAKKIGGKVALFTVREKSTLSSLSDLVITIPAYTDKIEDSKLVKPLLPGGTLFEEAMLLIGDSIVLPLAEIHHISTDNAFKLHANLE